ncbi:hypothetical protein [Roseimicrobium sp. ORNL1]|uniref:hypothetical protein n=1 Tax=Roseimicrobium sp. ORNL1 TaxID=2711231 RepID=UPI0013E20603|nr:hypothetical protein [Roseimicrobium sp. ORNL1]QIF01342.1 hypothetical protein G5S37_07345 [Roseimicrobium sp. ORNL1]
MSEEARHCSICGDLLVEVEAALNRTWGNVIATGFGSSVLEIRNGKADWMPFMTPDRSARGLYCTKCGSLTIAPTLGEHRRALGLEP